MSHYSVFFVGTHQEVAHHAAPMSQRRPVEIVSANDVVNRAAPGDVALFYSEHFERFRSVIETLKRNRVATIYMIDGILEWRNAWENQPDEIACPHTMRPVLSDKVACIGENQARILNGWNNHGKVEIVGVPRFDRYRGANAAAPQSGRQHDGVFRLLVMTAKTPAFTERQWETVKKSLADLKQAAQRRGDKIEITWRLTRGLESLLKVENANGDVTGQELFEQLKAVDAVISTPSTGMIESMLAGKPTAALDYHNCPEYLSPAWRIGCENHIETVLDELQNPPVEKLQFQSMVLNQNLYQESPATPRMVELIEGVAREAATQIAAGETQLNFPKPILSIPAATAEVLDHRRLFPDDAAFVEKDRECLQALLSNARRHIGALEKRVGVLERDLNAAHEVFEQIHAHPVVGPLVRIRQRLWNSVYGAKRKAVPK